MNQPSNQEYFLYYNLWKVSTVCFYNSKPVALSLKAPNIDKEKNKHWKNEF